MSWNQNKEATGFNFELDEDETGILTEQSDLLLSDDGIVYDPELLQLYKGLQDQQIGDHRAGSFTTHSQDSHPPDDHSLDLTDDLEDELLSASADDSVVEQPETFVRGGGKEDTGDVTPIPAPSDPSVSASLAEFQVLEEATRSPATPSRSLPPPRTSNSFPAEDEALLDEFLRDAEKSHASYSQLLRSQRTASPSDDEKTEGARRLKVTDQSRRDSADFEVEHISVSRSQAPAWPAVPEEPARGSRLLPTSPPRARLSLEPEAASEEELELVNAHRRLDEGAIDPIELYDQLRHQMDVQHIEEEEEAKRRSATPKQRLSLSSWSSGIEASESSGLSAPKVASPLVKTALSPIQQGARPVSRPTSSESNVSVDTVKQKGARRDRPNAEERSRKTRGGGERRQEKTRLAEEGKKRSREASRGSQEQLAYPTSEVEQWLREQPEPARGRLSSQLGPLRPSHLELGSTGKQDSMSSCDSDDLGSLLSGRSESKTALKRKLKQEILASQRQADQIEVLRSKYGQLLTKHALAEVTIDQLRVNAKVNLDYNLSHSLSELPAAGGGGSNRAHSVMERSSQPPLAAGSLSHLRADPRTLTSAPNFHSLPPSPSAELVGNGVARRLGVSGAPGPRSGLLQRPSAPDILAPLRDSGVSGLREAAGDLLRRLSAFSGLLADNELPVGDQEETVSSLRQEYDRLSRKYDEVGRAEPLFDRDRGFEGEMFQLGMQLDDLAERVASNARMAKRKAPFSKTSQSAEEAGVGTGTSMSATSPSTAADLRSPSLTGGNLSSGHSTGLSMIRREALEDGPNAELSERLTELEDHYLRLMGRYNDVKGKLNSPEAEVELQRLMKELTRISEEAAGLSQIISTPQELAEQFRFDQEASILDQELEQAAAEEQEQQMQLQKKQQKQPGETNTSAKPPLSRQGSRASTLGLRSEDLEWSSNATTAVQRRAGGSRSGYTTGTTGGGLSDMSGASSRAPEGRRARRPRHNYSASMGSRSSLADSGLSTPVGGDRRGGSRKAPGQSLFAAEVDSGFVGSDARPNQAYKRSMRDGRGRSSPLQEWSTATELSTASTVTAARRSALRRRSAAGTGARDRLGEKRLQNGERRPISAATSMESAQSNRLRSLEQDVHWLKEQLTGSQLSLAGASTPSGLNLDRYDPDTSAGLTMSTTDGGRLSRAGGSASALRPSSRRRSRSLPGPNSEGAHTARRERSHRPSSHSRATPHGGRDRRSRLNADTRAHNDVTSDDLESSSGGESFFDEDTSSFRRRLGAGRRRSQSPLVEPLRAGVDGIMRPRSSGGGRRRNRRRRGGSADAEEEEDYDPYQRYMSEPFALRRERHGAYSEDEEDFSSGAEEFEPRRRSRRSHQPAAVPGRGILRPPGSSPADLPPSGPRRRSRPPSAGWRGASPAANCPLCGGIGLHGHKNLEPDVLRDGNLDPELPLREYVSHGGVRYYVREYSASGHTSYCGDFGRSFAAGDVNDEDFEDYEVESNYRRKQRLNNSLSEAIRAAKSMGRVAEKVKASLRNDAGRTLERKWTMQY